MRRLLFVIVVMGAAAGARAAPSCKSLSASAVAFAPYDVYSAAAQPSVPGTITYSCPNAVTPTLSIDAGLHGVAGQRNMQGTTGADLLAYDLYFDAACTQPWAPNASFAVSAAASSMSFYACLSPLQDVSVGSYSDTLTVTINF